MGRNHPDFNSFLFKIMAGTSKNQLRLSDEQLSELCTIVKPVFFRRVNLVLTEIRFGHVVR
jgi:hypothetical protein